MTEKSAVCHKRTGNGLIALECAVEGVRVGGGFVGTAVGIKAVMSMTCVVAAISTVVTA